MSSESLSAVAGPDCHWFARGGSGSGSSSGRCASGGGGDGFLMRPEVRGQLRLPS